jgi:hypothetical protein
MALAIEIRYLSRAALETRCLTGTQPSAAGRGGFCVASKIGINPNSWALDDVPALRHLADGAGILVTDWPAQRAG